MTKQQGEKTVRNVIFLCVFIFILLSLLVFIDVWKYLISDFWCIRSIATIFFHGFSQTSSTHMYQVTHVKQKSFRKLWTNKSSTVQPHHRHAMFLSGNKRHWIEEMCVLVPHRGQYYVLRVLCFVKRWQLGRKFELLIQMFQYLDQNMENMDYRVCGALS